MILESMRKLGLETWLHLVQYVALFNYVRKWKWLSLIMSVKVKVVLFRWSSPNSSIRSTPSQWWAASTSRWDQDHDDDHHHRDDDDGYDHHCDDDDGGISVQISKTLSSRLALPWSGTWLCTTPLPITGIQQFIVSIDHFILFHPISIFTETVIHLFQILI